MSDFNYQDHGSDTLSEEQRKRLRQNAEEYASLVNKAKDENYISGYEYDLELTCTMLRHIDRLEKDNPTP